MVCRMVTGWYAEDGQKVPLITNVGEDFSASSQRAPGGPERHQGAAARHHGQEDLAADPRRHPEASEQDRDHAGDERESDALDPRSRGGLVLFAGHWPFRQVRQARRSAPVIGAARVEPWPPSSTMT